MDNNSLPQKINKYIKDVAPMIIGEALVMPAVILGGFVLGLLDLVTFDACIVSGAVLGALIAIFNYTFMVISVDRAIDNFLALRGNKEINEEEAAKFAKENSAAIQNAIKNSFVLRTATMMGALIIAFITGWFNPLATVIPVLSFRPILTVASLLKSKNDKKPDPEKFIKYDFEDENNETEKENDQ